MRRAYIGALAAAAIGLGAVGWGLAAGSAVPPAVLLVAAAFAPAAVLLAVWGRLEGRFPTAALLVGALAAPLVALVGEAFAFAFTAAFIQGFADSGRHLLEALRADPQLTTALSSPWVVVLLVETVAVAPLTEEAAKGVGARLARPRSRRQAFLFGVAAGVGFAVTENVLYAGLAWAYGSPWPAVALSRSVGAAVHPLACGVVMLGWWEWRHGGGVRALVGGYFAGVGIHALWNGSLVVLAVVETVLSVHGTVPASLEPLAITVATVLGAVLAGVLALTTTGVAAERPALRALRLRERRTLAGWTMLSASLLVPIAILVVAFPAFYRG